MIYGYAVVDSVGKLTIEPGTKIYVHKKGGLWVYKGGCLHVNGTIDNPVVFQGDRMEDFFKTITNNGIVFGLTKEHKTTLSTMLLLKMLS